MSRNSVILVLAGWGLVLVGCNENVPESNQTLRTTIEEVVTEPNIHLLSITSEQYYFANKEKEIRARLEGEINSGQYNIVAVQTSYSSGYLTFGEIAYDVRGIGGGNNLRVLFIYSDKYGRENETEEIQPRLNEIINSGQYRLVEIKMVYEVGHLFAAEVYYHSK